MPDQVLFVDEPRCWICEQADFDFAFPACFALSQFAGQDVELSAYTGARIEMRRCRKCGFIQPEAMPGLPGYFDRMYNQHWSEEWIQQDFDNTYKDLIFRTILTELDRRTLGQRGTKKLLDIGAHAGKFLDFARNAGWQPEGIELNPRTAAYAERRTGLPVHRANASTLAASGHHRYRAVTLTDVLEHLPFPVRILRTAAHLLEPGGWIAVKVPCGPNQLTKERIRAHLGHPDNTGRLAENLVHINHFSPKSLRLALKQSGFSRITLTIGAPELADLAKRSGLKSRFSNLGRKAVYQTARWLPGGLYTPLALNLQAYAQRD